MVAQPIGEGVAEPGRGGAAAGDMARRGGTAPGVPTTGEPVEANEAHLGLKLTGKSKSLLGVGNGDLAKGRLVSSKVTWRVTITLFEERSTHWKPLWPEK